MEHLHRWVLLLDILQQEPVQLVPLQLEYLLILVLHLDTVKFLELIQLEV